MRANIELERQEWLPAFFQQIAEDYYSAGDFTKLQALANLQETLEEDPSSAAWLRAKITLLWRGAY